MIDAGEYRTAYLIARDAALPARDIYKTEQEFTAGWIALRFLNDPALAAQHFARIGVGSVNPTALARAGYWQGRAAEAAGRAQEARAAYTRAAEQSTSYYGQLARAKLGLPQIELNGALPRGRGAERLEIVRAVQLLYELDEREIAIPIFADMGENGDPEALAGLGEVDRAQWRCPRHAADGQGRAQSRPAVRPLRLPGQRHSIVQADRAGGRAEHRLRDRAAGKRVQPGGGLAGAGLRPDAGDPGRRALCLQAAGVGFDLSRMKTDPVYNAALGAAELGGLLEDYRGSYILTFAAYNAGRGSVKKWIDRYGDPRDPKVDAVDWVELIPFSETRNYVQRIMENLQVYRARFGGGSRLQIEADLRRGGSVE